MAKMPVLFLGHGSPMNIIAHNAFTASLAHLGQTLPRPEAILVVSAHWLTEGGQIASSPLPETIYDFFGFPPELYQISYPCPGSPSLARETEKLLSGQRAIPGWRASCNPSRGMDHAGWAVLHHMYPAADIPVVSLSLDYTLSPSEHYQLAASLQPLRDQGVLVIGSGNIVHNLHLANFRDMDGAPHDWSLRFDAAVKELLLYGRHDSLIHYHTLGAEARLAVPTNEHYLPMLYVLALQETADRLTFIHESMQNASISMRCFLLSQD